MLTFIDLWKPRGHSRCGTVKDPRPGPPDPTTQSAIFPVGTHRTIVHASYTSQREFNAEPAPNPMSRTRFGNGRLVSTVCYFNLLTVIANLLSKTVISPGILGIFKGK